MGKFIELIEKMPETKITIQPSFAHDCVHVYNIDILKLLDL